MRCFTFLPVAFLLSYIENSAGWVFTDVNYSKLARDLDVEDEFADTELTDEELKQLRFSLIYPTTKWCGAGNVADSYDDLGSSVEADKCCRAHDLCPDVLQAGDTKHNLTNDAFYSRQERQSQSEFKLVCTRTAINHKELQAGDIKHNFTNDVFYSRLSCDCDEEFRQCLHKANTKVANQIGTIYFNALGTQCYRNDYPIKRCKRRGGWLNRKCLEYEFDANGMQKYQWFYVPNY